MAAAKVTGYSSRRGQASRPTANVDVACLMDFVSAWRCWVQPDTPACVWFLRPMRGGGGATRRGHEDLEFDMSLGVDAEDSGDGWVGVVASDDDEVAGDGDEPGVRVGDPRPQAPVIGHVRDSRPVARE